MFNILSNNYAIRQLAIRHITNVTLKGTEARRYHSFSEGRLLFTNFIIVFNNEHLHPYLFHMYKNMFKCKGISLYCIHRDVYIFTLLDMTPPYFRRNGRFAFEHRLVGRQLYVAFTFSINLSEILHLANPLLKKIE